MDFRQNSDFCIINYTLNKYQNIRFWTEIIATTLDINCWVFHCEFSICRHAKTVCRVTFFFGRESFSTYFTFSFIFNVQHKNWKHFQLLKQRSIYNNRKDEKKHMKQNKKKHKHTQTYILTVIIGILMFKYFETLFWMQTKIQYEKNAIHFKKINA